MSDVWCDDCRAPFPVSHYEGPPFQWRHKVGAEWGPTGVEQAELRDLRAQVAAQAAVIEQVRAWAYTAHAGTNMSPADVWPGLRTILTAAPTGEAT